MACITMHDKVWSQYAWYLYRVMFTAITHGTCMSCSLPSCMLPHCVMVTVMMYGTKMTCILLRTILITIQCDIMYSAYHHLWYLVLHHISMHGTCLACIQSMVHTWYSLMWNMHDVPNPHTQMIYWHRPGRWLGSWMTYM